MNFIYVQMNYQKSYWRLKDEEAEVLFWYEYHYTAIGVIDELIWKTRKALGMKN